MTAKRATDSLEKTRVANIAKALRARGAWVAKIHGGMYGTSGIPDLLCCFHGAFVALEVKRPGNKPTPSQAAQLEGITRAGGRALVVHDADEALAILSVLDGSTSS
jgi:hypothetical protein